MKNYHLLATLMLPALLLAGCGGTLFESKKVEYKAAAQQQLPPLDIPPDLTTPNRDERYAVPDIAPKGSATFSSYSGERSGKPAAAATTTATTTVLPQAAKMRLERSGMQRWLVVTGTTPSELWPKVKAFWQESGFNVVVEMPEAGIMETDWNENRAKIPQDFIRRTIGKVFDSAYSSPERDKYRTRLEKGAEPGATEIYISHRGMVEVYTDTWNQQTQWQPRAPDPELEVEMLGRLMVRLGADETQAKAMVATADQKTVERAKLDRAGASGGALQLAEPFDRAWRRVGLALDRVGFTVEDRDRTQGVYFVRYVDPESDSKMKDDKGLLAKLMFWKGSKSDATQNAQFRIRVKGVGESSTVSVLTREGGPDQSETSKKILGLLFEQLK